MNLGVENDSGTSFAAIRSWVDTGTFTFDENATSISLTIGTGASDGSWRMSWFFTPGEGIDTNTNEDASGDQEDFVRDVASLTGNVLTLSDFGELAFSSDATTFIWGGYTAPEGDIGSNTSILLGVLCN